MERTLYIFSNGKLTRKDNTLSLETEEGRKHVPVEATREILIFGEVDVTKKFLELASRKEIIIHYFNYYGYYSGTFYPREHRNSGYMILRQAEHYLDGKRRQKLASTFVRGSLANMRQVAKYYSGRGCKAMGALVEKLEGAVRERINDSMSPEELMAVEGECRSAYYACWDAVIKNEAFQFERRSRRPPENRLNTLISFGNSLLYTTVLSEIYKTHLDPRIGFLHATNFRRFTLNLDVAEIFKPIIVDRLIFTIIGKQMIKPSDFDKETYGMYLKESGRKNFIEAYDQRLETTIEHRQLGRKVSYRRLIRLELYRLQKHLMEEQEYEPYVSRW